MGCLTFRPPCSRSDNNFHLPESRLGAKKGGTGFDHGIGKMDFRKGLAAAIVTVAAVSGASAQQSEVLYSYKH